MNFKVGQTVIFKLDVGFAYNPKAILPADGEKILLIGKSQHHHNGWYVKGYETDKDGGWQSLCASDFRPIQYSSASYELAASFKETIETSDMPIVEPKKEKV